MYEMRTTIPEKYISEKGVLLGFYLIQKYQVAVSLTFGRHTGWTDDKVMMMYFRGNASVMPLPVLASVIFFLLFQTVISIFLLHQVRPKLSYCFSLFLSVGCMVNVFICVNYCLDYNIYATVLDSI